MKRLWELALGLVIALSAGCAQVEEVRAGPSDAVRVENLSVDKYLVTGQNIQTFWEVPKRVLVMGESEQELLMDLGVDMDSLVLVRQNNRKYTLRKENEEKFERAQSIPSTALNMEYVMSLKPDLIVGMQSTFVRSRLNNTAYWNRKGIKTMVSLNTNTRTKFFHEETLEREMQFIEDMGRVFRREDRARQIVEEVEAVIDRINEETRTMYKPKVMFVESSINLICFDRRKLAGDMAARIGGRVSHLPAVIGMEHIIREDPDVLFVVCSHRDYGRCADKIWNHPGLKDLKCLQNRDVYTIPLRFTYGSASRTKDGIVYLAERMYHKDFSQSL